MYLGRFKVHYMWGKWKIMKVKHWLVTKIFFIIIAEKFELMCLNVLVENGMAFN